MISPILEHRVGLAIAGNQTDGLYQHPHAVTGLVRQALLESGLGQKDPQRPLMDIIGPGNSVLLKPNWVLHYNQSGQTMDCMVTHPTFILAVVQEVAAAGAGRILVADAPIQSTNLEVLVPEEFRDALRDAAGKATLEIVDFRRTIVQNADLVKGLKTELRGEERCVRFDLGGNSLLEPISEPKGCFRNTCYSPEKLADTHCRGKHEYVLSKEVFEVDVVINLPKLKTHRKAGITGALKNPVGMNGDKDNLPHHRVGGTFWKGDCYEGCAPLKRLAEVLLDQANYRIGTEAYSRWIPWVWRLHRWHVKLGGDGNIEGAWHGNDTVWRMVLDLNRIILYGRIDGSMADEPQRRIYCLTDAIVCGEGNGPLAPTPRFVGAVTFSATSWAADTVHCALLGLDEQYIPLVRESTKPFRWPLKTGDAPLKIRYLGTTIPLDEVAEKLGVRANPPQGWVGHIERSVSARSATSANP